MAYATQQQHHSPTNRPTSSSSSSSSTTARHQRSHSQHHPPSHRSGSIHLDNFNEHAQECLINSPRSLAALKRLGIAPTELQFRPPSHRSFHEGVDQATADILPDFAERRFQHYEAKRQAKVRALREERARMIEQGDHGAHGGTMTLYTGHPSHRGSDSQLVVAARDRASTALEMEKEEIARMQQRLLTKLNNTLAFEIRRAQTLDRAQSKVDYANARAEAEKQYRAQLQAHRDQQQKQAVAEAQRRLAEEAEQRRQAADEAWRQTQAEKAAKLEEERERRRAERAAQIDQRNRNEEKRQQLEAIQEMQRQQIAEKEARLAWKEAERLRHTEESRRQLQEYNAEQQRLAKQKLDEAAQRAAQYQEEKRQRFLDKEAQAEEKRREFEEAREHERQQARERARQKEIAIKQAQQQADLILQAKAEATLAKEQQAAERLAERERMKQMDEHERKMWLQDREAHRRAILEQSYWLREERGQQILAKRAELNERSNETLRQREAELRERRLHEKMLESDRIEQVRRMSRIKENQREELLRRIQADRERIDSLQQQSNNLARQRLKLRDMAEKQQALILEQFEKLKAHPEKLRNLDPNHVDVVKMGFLSQEDMAQLLSFNTDGDTSFRHTDDYSHYNYHNTELVQDYSFTSPSHTRTRSASQTPTRRVLNGSKSNHSSNTGMKSNTKRASSARRGRSIDNDNTPIMDRPLPRPQTSQGRINSTQYGQPSTEYMQYATQLQTH